VGNGPAGASLLPPPSDLTLHARWHADPQLFWFVTHGVAGTGMPAFADLLSPGDRWDDVNYLHVLANAPTATPLVPPATRSTPSATPAASPAASPPPSAALPSSSPSPASGGAGVAPSRSGLSGRIIYGPDTDHDFWVIRLPDGQPQRITSFGRLEFPSSPAWSPDGQQVAYAFYELPNTGGIPLPPGTDVYVMQADGSRQRAVAPHDVQGAVLQNPVWTPDGAALYVSYQAQKPSGLDVGIDRVDVASGARQRVVRNAVAPTLSRDGSQLAYALLPSGNVRSFTLWRSAADGSAPFQLVGPNVFVKYEGLSFSPDGKRLVFAAVGTGQGYIPPTASLPGSPFDVLRSWLEPPVALADGDLWDLWTIDVDGRNLRRITAINEDLPANAWSADGRSIAFLGGGSAATAEAGVTIVDASGGPLLRLTSQPGHRGLDWTRGP
jgi:Tol biopolymer transport system component